MTPPISGSLNNTTLARQDLAVLDGEQLVVDLSMVSFVEPIGLVQAAAEIDRARRSGHRVVFRPPGDVNVARYLSRMGVDALLEGWSVDHRLPRLRSVSPLEAELLELRRFSGQGGGEELANLINTKLESMNVDSQVVNALYEAICELAANVAMHAGVECGFVAAQTLHGGTRIFFAVGDSGVGLKATLQTSIAVTDDENAVSLAVQRNVSGTGQRGRGQGLPEVKATVAGLGGELYIRSGGAAGTFTRSGDRVTATGATFNGTLIQGSLPCRP